MSYISQPLQPKKVPLLFFIRGNIHRQQQLLRQKNMPKQKKDNTATAKHDALVAEAKFLRLENTELKARLSGIRAKVQARMREIERGVEQRLKTAEVPAQKRAGIMEYMKVGFGTMLGVLAAVALVDVVEDVFDEDEVPADEVPENEVPPDAFGDIFGGRAAASYRKKTAARPRKKTAKKSNESVSVIGLQIRSLQRGGVK